MNKCFYFFSWLSIMAGAIFILLLTFWLVFPYRPIEFQDVEFSVKNTMVQRGKMLFYTANYCKYMKLSAKVTRSFVNSIIYVTPTTITDRPMGCNSLVIGTTVPQELPPGTYKAEMSYQFQVNPIRTVIVKMTTEEFEVY